MEQAINRSRPRHQGPLRCVETNERASTREWAQRFVAAGHDVQVVNLMTMLSQAALHGRSVYGLHFARACTLHNACTLKIGHKGDCS